MLRHTFDHHFLAFEPNYLSKGIKRFFKHLWHKFRSCFLIDIQTVSQRNWIEWARRLPRSAFILWLAGHVADELLTHKSRSLPMSRLLASIDDASSGAIQHEAERFIENYYFGYPSHDPKMGKMIQVFRRIVKRKLRKHVENLPV